MYNNCDDDDSAGDDEGGGNDDDAKEAGGHQHQYQIYQEKASTMSRLSSSRQNIKKQQWLATLVFWERKQTIFCCRLKLEQLTSRHWKAQKENYHEPQLDLKKHKKSQSHWIIRGTWHQSRPTKKYFGQPENEMSKYICGISLRTISSPKSGQVSGFYENCKWSGLRSERGLPAQSPLPPPL